MYVACSVKGVRIDEFDSLKFDAIKPKLFENERFSTCANEHSFSGNLRLFLDEDENKTAPSINLRIDFPKGDSTPPANVTIQVDNRTLSIASHAIDILLQNLEEIHTREEKSLRRARPHKFIPIDVYLNNVQLSMNVCLTITSFRFIDISCFI